MENLEVYSVVIASLVLMGVGVRSGSFGDTHSLVKANVIYGGLALGYLIYRGLTG